MGGTTNFEIFFPPSGKKSAPMCGKWYSFLLPLRSTYTSFPLFRLPPSVCSKALEKVTSLASSPHLLHRHGVGRGNGKKGDFSSRSSGKDHKDTYTAEETVAFPVLFRLPGEPTCASHSPREKSWRLSGNSSFFTICTGAPFKNLRVVVDESGPQGVEVHGDGHGGAAGANLVRRHLEVWFQ